MAFHIKKKKKKKKKTLIPFKFHIMQQSHNIMYDD